MPTAVNLLYARDTLGEKTALIRKLRSSTKGEWVQWSGRSGRI